MQHVYKKGKQVSWQCFATCVGSGVERIDPLCFLAKCRKRQINQALSVLSLSICFWVCFILFIKATFCVPLVCICICSVSWLFWLSCQYLPSDWLERLLWGSLFMARRLSAQSPGKRTLMNFFGLVYCFMCVCLVPGPMQCIILLWHEVACLCWTCH